MKHRRIIKHVFWYRKIICIISKIVVMLKTMTECIICLHVEHTKLALCQQIQTRIIYLTYWFKDLKSRKSNRYLLTLVTWELMWFHSFVWSIFELMRRIYYTYEKNYCHIFGFPTLKRTWLSQMNENMWNVLKKMFIQFLNFLPFSGSVLNLPSVKIVLTRKYYIHILRIIFIVKSLYIGVAVLLWDKMIYTCLLYLFECYLLEFWWRVRFRSYLKKNNSMRLVIIVFY